MRLQLQEISESAQDVQEVFPELVITKSDGTLTMNYIGLIAPMIETIKAQQAEIELLKARLDALESSANSGNDKETGEQ